MAGVAETASDHERAESGFGKDAGIDVIGKAGLQGETVHFGEFVAADGVDFLAKKRRQSEEVVEISQAEKVVLIAEKFVSAISAETERPAKEKLRYWTGVAVAKSSAPLRGDENGSGPGDGLEKLKLRFHGGKSLGSAGTGVVPAKSGFRSVATTRNDGVIAMVNQKMQFCVTDAS